MQVIRGSQPAAGTRSHRPGKRICALMYDDHCMKWESIIYRLRCATLLLVGRERVQQGKYRHAERVPCVFFRCATDTHPLPQK